MMIAFNREALKNAIRKSIKRVFQAQTADVNLYRNTLDCFSASIDSVIQGISMEEWLVQEKERQIQKTKQNAIGSLHEDIMGSIPGVTSLPVGNLIDIISERLLLVAEVKNKHNTTKGNHKVQIYRDLAQAIARHPGYIAYYVEILPKGQGRYNLPFTPSDNQTNSRLLSREDIRVIDGKSFYALLTGHENAINELYAELPLLVAEIIKEEFGKELSTENIVNSDSFMHSFRKAYE
jgi:hypothetical protein